MMDLVSFVLYFVLGGRLIPNEVTIPLNVAVWAFFGVVLCGLITELADKAGFRYPLAYGIAVAVMPPVGLPIFLTLRKRVAFDHRGLCLRRWGYRAAIVAVIILVLLEFMFVPGYGPTANPPRPTLLTL